MKKIIFLILSLIGLNAYSQSCPGISGTGIAKYKGTTVCYDTVKVTSYLNTVIADTFSCTKATIGGVTIANPPGGTTTFLRGDGTFAVPPGTGPSGTVTTVSVATANGISGSVANPTTTPAITLTLGAITPSTVNGVTLSGSSTPTLAVTGTTTVSGTHSGTSSGTNTGDQTSVTGNAGTATALQTPRAINGTNFDGTAPITVTAAAGTLAGSALNSGVTASSLVSFGTSPSLVAPLLGTPTSGVLTNCTGTASGLTAGNVTTNANLTGPITSSGNATSIASQTGTTTTFVMQDSPIITTQAIIPTIYGSSSSGGNLQLTSTSNATKGFIYFGGSSGYDGVNVRLGIGTQTPTSPLHLVSNSTATFGATQFNDVYDATTASSVLAFRKGRGTSGSPTKALSGDGLGFVSARGYTTDLGFTTSSNAAISFQAAEDFTASTSTGTNFQVELTPTGSASRVAKFSVTGNGMVSTGTNTPAANLDINNATVSANAWTTNGIGIRQRATTYTDLTSATGTVAAVYGNYYGVPTINSTNAVTYTTAYSNVFEGMVGTGNANVTNSRSALFKGSVDCSGTAFNFTAGATIGIGTADANIFNLKTGNTTRLSIGTQGTLVHTGTAQAINQTFLKSTQPDNTGGLSIGWQLIGGSLTSQTSAAEITDVKLDLSATAKSIDGTIPTNRSMLVLGRTLTPQTSALTVTNPITMEIQPPIAGSGTTFTNRPLAIRSTGDISVTGTNATFIHVVGGGSSPTIAAGTGAGTSPTVSVTGTDLGGYISVTTGTLPTLAAAVVTITFNTAFTTAPRCISLSSANSNTSTLSGVSMVYVNQAGITTTTFAITAGATALTAATAYQWYYQVIQ